MNEKGEMAMVLSVITDHGARPIHEHLVLKTGEDFVGDHLTVAGQRRVALAFHCALDMAKAREIIREGIAHDLAAAKEAKA